MSTRSHIIAALCLFCLFTAYGFQASLIEVFPGQEQEPFKPKTLPLALAWAGILLCAIRIVQLVRAPARSAALTLASYDWKRAASLCLIMLAYEWMLLPLGFVVATSIFLLAGFLVLGERRIVLLLVFPPLFSTLFYLVMTRALGLYLSPGAWWPAGVT